MKFAGTPNYMAPEIFNKKAYDKKVDVFAYGTLIWEIFQRKVPYDGLEPGDIGERVCGKDTLSMQGLHKKIAALIQECRDKDPKKRPDFDSIIQTLAGIDI
jgi:serine/threonine protein kinase